MSPDELTMKVPDHIVEAYGSARAFKADKRKCIKDMQVMLLELRRGSTYLPCGTGPIEDIQKALDMLTSECSEKKWGR